MSFGVRITLIKAALANLPIYFMSLFKFPVEVIKRIEKLQRDFLWHGHEKKKKFHLIKWSQVCKSKEDGGLGIRTLKETNLALLGKWLWKIGDGSEALWKQLLFSKYGTSRDGWEVRDPMPRWEVRDPMLRYSAIWKGILASKEMFSKNIRCRAGKGGSLFLDRPLGGGTL